ncbi:CHAD domain-containing protein [Paraburkholderia ferrariae]|uniref:CHAD domain-containing protein n=1 Tax=Paraburkholderia ferrariae TaxID=386056 RepID=UPI000694D4ED|nr:CHAD domain-containing protein [Paraburkholderia ferrariae]
MVRVLEIVLDIVLLAPAAPHKHAPRGLAAPATLAAAFIDALPQLGTATVGGARVATTLFGRDDCDTRRALDGWRIAVETRGDASKVAVSRRHALTPGIHAITPIFEAPLDADGIADSLFDAAPEPFREALAAVGKPVPVVGLSAVRYRWPWVRDGIEAELILDAQLHETATASDLAEEGPRLHELRVRAPWPDDADPAPIADVLFACADALIDAAPADAPAFVRMTDALERAATGSLAGGTEAARAAPVDLAGAHTDAAALVAIGRNISAQWFGNDAGVRDSPKTEFIHQMRVSQRRLRTAMRIFARWQDETWSAQIKPDLKWLGDLLGEARDRDVFVESTLPALAAADTEPERWAAVREEADQARLVARARVRDALRSPRYAHVALAWLRWLAALAARVYGETAGEGPHDTARPLHEQAQKRVRRYYKHLAETPRLTAIDEASRHQARINAKYLRYTLEFFAPIASRRTRTETARTLARLQSVLGDGNDAAVALRFIEAMAIDPYLLGFARGWCEAVKRSTAKEGERLLRELPKPKVSGE